MHSALAGIPRPYRHGPRCSGHDVPHLRRPRQSLVGATEGGGRGKEAAAEVDRRGLVRRALQESFALFGQSDCQARPSTSDTLVPPKPNEFDIASCSFAANGCITGG